MAERIAHLKVNIDPGAMNDIKKSLMKDIASVIEDAYSEGWVDGIGGEDIDRDWKNSETKKKLDEFIKS
jgi:glycine cleavage system H lipoate-binding protein